MKLVRDAIAAGILNDLVCDIDSAQCRQGLIDYK